MRDGLTGFATAVFENADKPQLRVAAERPQTLCVDLDDFRGMTGFERIEVVPVRGGLDHDFMDAVRRIVNGGIMIGNDPDPPSIVDAFSQLLGRRLILISRTERTLRILRRTLGCCCHLEGVGALTSPWCHDDPFAGERMALHHRRTAPCCRANPTTSLKNRSGSANCIW